MANHGRRASHTLSSSPGMYADLYEQYLDSPVLASNEAVFEADVSGSSGAAPNVMTTPLLNMDGQFGAPPDYFINSPASETDDHNPFDSDASSLDQQEQERLHQEAIQHRRFKYNNYHQPLNVSQVPPPPIPNAPVLLSSDTSLAHADAPPSTETVIDDKDEGAAKIIQQVRDQATGKTITQTVRKSIKDFKLGKELGEGSYSTVVLATDLTTNVQYAIKMLSKRYIIKEDKVKYVKLEKDALNRLNNHPGIVTLHYTFQDNQNLYFVLDYAENGELLTLIKRFNTMDEDSTRYYTMQLVDAIDYMHQNGIIHRDIKPENILIDSNFKIQITDFGTAKILDKDAETGNYPQDSRAKSFVGTAEYVSPELLNNKYCGKPADIWALGCIIYQMIGGKPPFKGANEYLTFQKVQKLQYAFTAGFPIVVRDLIKRILVLKPESRLTIDQIKQHYWFKDKSWSRGQVWGQDPPVLSAYKITAKAMKPVPELDLQYKPNFKRNGSATSSRSGSTNIKNSASVPSIPSYTAVINAAAASRVPSSSSAAVAAQRLSSDNLQSQPSASSSIQLAPQSAASSSQPKNAACAALYGSSNGADNNGIAGTSGSHHHPPPHGHVRKTSSSGDKPRNVIPGTNIPRPTINTKVPAIRSSYSSSGKRKPPSSSNGGAEVAQMSVLDLKWVKYMTNHNERVIKAGLVKVFKDSSLNFEKRNKGCITESPLGYKNKDTIQLSQEKSIMVDYKDEEINVYDPNDEEANASSTNKLIKFFVAKPPLSVTSIETQFQLRILVITTFGRALFFNQRGDKMTMEVNLTHSHVKFVEVLSQDSSKQHSGRFAVCFGPNEETLLCECEMNEVSNWTMALFKSRILEKERLHAEEGKVKRADEMMINAAVSKAVSMASSNAGVGATGNGSDTNGSGNKRVVTPMNSKFLARSRLR